ncbi:MAG TPA: NAD(P)/FAD-dependent oxidoreductase [Bdellovibrionales bacterium]|nr:NAD(P)/FAD-dependent oxidoreductase [Bdellovibrionales bacterium]
MLDIEKLRFIDPEEHSRFETEDGQSLVIYRDVDRMETELLRQAPEDAEEIRKFAGAIRRFARLDMPPSPELNFENAVRMFKMVPHLGELKRWSGMTLKEYSARFKNPLLRKFFGESSMSELSAIALLFSLVWMTKKDGGYPIGGSAPLIGLIVEKFKELGGRIHFGSPVRKILVENDRAVGLALANGETVRADWVISAADGHATIYDLLEGRYKDSRIDEIYTNFQTFPSYFQISFGIADKLDDLPDYLVRVLKEPIRFDPQTSGNQLAFRVFHFDPTLAPEGKTSVTCFVPTDNAEYWVKLRAEDKDAYKAQKARIAEEVLQVLERRRPGIRTKVEVTDVATPATVFRYTGNWKGSMEGWLLTPKTGFSPLKSKLPGLKGFRMIGQWVMPGGGLPSGLITGRSVIREIVKED